MTTCGSTCITDASNSALSNCEYNYGCVCNESSFVSAFYACLNEFCDASGFEIWTEYATQLCSYYGIVWPSSAPSPQSTVTFTPVAGTTLSVSASISTTVVVVPSIITSFSGVTSSNFFAQTSLASINLASTASAATTSPFALIPSASPDSQPTSNGLSSGAIAGISVGVAALFFFAVLAFLLWHRKRHQQETPPAVIVPVNDGYVADIMPFEKESKAAATVIKTVPIQYPSEIPAEPLQPNHTYQTPVSPIDSRYRPPLSPSPAYTEIAGTTAVAEVGTSHGNRLTANQSMARPGFLEADSTPLSHNITSPASELEDPSFVYHELPIEQPLHAQTATRTSAQELASSSVTQATTAVSREERQAGPVEEAGEDPELARMKAEIEQLRAEKEREMRLLSMEARERELSRNIVQMELRASSGGTVGGTGGGGGAGGGAS